MDDYESLGHTACNCKYHIILFRSVVTEHCMPTLYAHLRPYLGEIFRRLAMQRESRIEVGHLMNDQLL